MAEKQLNQFAQDFFDAWDLAALGKLTLEFPTRAQAVNFRHRMYSFRSKFRKDCAPRPTPYDTIELSIEQLAEDRWQITTRVSAWREQIRRLKAEQTPSDGS